MKLLSEIVEELLALTTIVFFFIFLNLLTDSRIKDFMSYAFEHAKKNGEINDDADKHRAKLPNDIAADLLHEISCYTHNK